MAKHTCPICNAPTNKENGCWKHSIRKPLRKSSLKKKAKTKEQVEENKKEIEKQWEFFLSISNNRTLKSEITGKYLGSEAKSIFFHHIMPKSKYKELAYEPENIIILSFEEHQKVEQDMYYYEEINKRREYLIEKFLK